MSARQRLLGRRVLAGRTLNLLLAEVVVDLVGVLVDEDVGVGGVAVAAGPDEGADLDGGIAREDSLRSGWCIQLLVALLRSTKRTGDTAGRRIHCGAEENVVGSSAVHRGLGAVEDCGQRARAGARARADKGG